MFCPKCGAKNNDNAEHCVICKSSLPKMPAAAAPAAGAPVHPTPSAAVLAANPSQRPSSHLIPALITTLFCCIPAGIVAIVYSLQVESKISSGDLAGAQRASNNAKTWSFVAAGLGFVVMGIWILIAIIGVAAEVS